MLSFYFFHELWGWIAYTPITWVDGLPSSLFEPPCIADTQHEDKSDSLRQRDIRADFFSVVPYGGYGLAVQAGLHCNDVLNGVYGKIYIPVGVIKTENNHSRIEAIADFSLLMGLTAIKRGSFELEAYAIGKTPMVNHTSFSSLLQDDNVSGGFGSSCFIRLCGSPEHHLDCLSEADILFHAPHKRDSTTKRIGGWTSYKQNLRMNIDFAV